MNTALRLTTRTRSFLSLACDDGTNLDVELSQAAYDEADVLAQVVGDTLVVAYLVQDGDAPNPLQAGMANGTLVTRGTGYARHAVITDDRSRFMAHLGLADQDDPEIDTGFELDGQRVTLRELAAQRYASLRPDPGHGPDVGAVDSAEDVEVLAHSLYSEHWQAIVGPFVVPAYYHAERGRVICRATSWDGDPDELPDGLWVADEGAQHAIRQSAVLRYRGEFVALFDSRGLAVAAARERYGEPTPGDLAQAAFTYADTVLRTYARWAECDVYGCVVEVFARRGDAWAQIAEDAVGGFVGHAHARQSLQDDFFHPNVERLQQALADRPDSTAR